jgi:hypothetical protein
MNKKGLMESGILRVVMWILFFILASGAIYFLFRRLTS